MSRSFRRILILALLVLTAATFGNAVTWHPAAIAGGCDGGDCAPQK